MVLLDVCLPSQRPREELSNLPTMIPAFDYGSKSSVCTSLPGSSALAKRQDKADSICASSGETAKDVVTVLETKAEVLLDEDEKRTEWTCV